MWGLINRTRYAAERTWIRDKHGVHHWVVVVKATYRLPPNAGPVLSDVQLEPLFAPQYFGDPARTSLRFEAEMGPPKPTTDVILNASAYAPHGRGAESVAVSLTAGPVRKELLVFGRRFYLESRGRVAPGRPDAFTVQPVRYEFAEGGTDTEHNDEDSRNPIGVGFARQRSTLAGRRAPSIEPMQGGLGNGPVGFGAIPANWSPRRELAGTFDDRWASEKKPLLPDDYDEQHCQCAPRDQQSPQHLVGGESVELVNLTPAGRLQFALPGVRLNFVTRVDGAEEHHAGSLSSILLEPDDERLVLLWQTSLRVPSAAAAYLDQTIVEEG